MGNNYTAINDLRRIQDDIMEAIAHANHILDRSLPVDELHLIAKSINDKQHLFRTRLHDHLRVVADCIALLDELEEREDLVQAECFTYLDSDLEDADEAKGQLVRANRAHGRWISRHLEGLKGLFGKQGVTA